MKTNAMRLLEKEGVDYSVIEYTYGENSNAIDVAKQINRDPNQVFKTIITSANDNQIRIFCLPSHLEIKMKLVRSLLNLESVYLVDTNKLLSLTGYLKGGVSPLATKHSYPFYLDEEASLWKSIIVNGGKRGFLIELNVEQLLRVGNGKLVNLTQ
ncbi:MAG: YbaK/EbsC family protein [Sphaerochaetaceae bacterium]